MMPYPLFLLISNAKRLKTLSVSKLKSDMIIRNPTIQMSRMEPKEPIFFKKLKSRQIYNTDIEFRDL